MSALTALRAWCNGRRRVAAWGFVLTIGIAAATVSGPRVADAARMSPNAWTTAKPIPSAESSVAPALAPYAGAIYAAWASTSAPASIIYAHFNGTTWSSDATIPSASTPNDVGIALAYYNGDLYAAWPSDASPSAIDYAAFNGTTWSAPAHILSAVVVSVAPALAAFNGLLYVAWASPYSPYQIWYSAFNGTAWSASAKIPSAEDGSFGRPALAVYDNALYVSWSAATKVSYAHLSGGTWSSPATIASSCQSRASGVALAAANGTLYDAWTDCSSSSLQYSKFNGTKPESPRALSSATTELTCAGPALVPYKSSLYVAWQWGPDQCYDPGKIDYSSEP